MIPKEAFNLPLRIGKPVLVTLLFLNLGNNLHTHACSAMGTRLSDMRTAAEYYWHGACRDLHDWARHRGDHSGPRSQSCRAQLQTSPSGSPNCYHSWQLGLWQSYTRGAFHQPNNIEKHIVCLPSYGNRSSPSSALTASAMSPTSFKRAHEAALHEIQRSFIHLCEYVIPCYLAKRLDILLTLPHDVVMCSEVRASLSSQHRFSRRVQFLGVWAYIVPPPCPKTTTLQGATLGPPQEDNQSDEVSQSDCGNVWHKECGCELVSRICLGQTCDFDKVPRTYRYTIGPNAF